MNAKVGDIVIPSSTAPEVAQLPQPAQLNPIQLVQIAIERGVGVDQLKELMTLQREWKADQARSAFVAALTAFRAEPLRVGKDKHVRYVSKRTGDVTEYNHATLAQVCDAVVIALSKHGLAHRWETKQEGQLISVACVLSHAMGHSERVSLSAPADDSGGKNTIQAVGSTVTYLQRYTLMAITGLAAKDQDDDARSAGDDDKITEKQVADLDALIEEVGAKKDAFLKTCKVDRIEDLPASKLKGAIERLEAKRK